MSILVRYFSFLIYPTISLLRNDNLLFGLTALTFIIFLCSVTSFYFLRKSPLWLRVLVTFVLFLLINVGITLLQGLFGEAIVCELNSPRGCYSKGIAIFDLVR